MRLLVIGVGALWLMCSTSHAHGQKATEQYIPIGQSPGVSGKYTSTGQITDVHVGTKTITIADPAGPRAVMISDKTHIWLDRSKLKQTSIRGRFTDLQKGRRVEVKYADPARRQGAEWVKVEIRQP